MVNLKFLCYYGNLNKLMFILKNHKQNQLNYIF